MEQNRTADRNRRPYTKPADLSDFVFAKLPPQATPLEEAVLGALMLDRNALTIVIELLKPDSFYSDAHQLIYRAMLQLFEESVPIDLLTMCEQLKKAGDLDRVGGAHYLVELTNRVTSSANVEYHARIVAQKHIQRELIRVSTDIIRDAYEDSTDVFDLLDKAEQGLFDITQQNLNKGHEAMSSLLGKAMKQIEELATKEDGLTGIPSGFTNLDKVTSGWQRSDLIIMAARPGMGKTSMTLALARNAALDYQRPVVFFSLEMSKSQLVQRIISLEAQIPGDRLRNGKLSQEEWVRLNASGEKLAQTPLFIDDTPSLNIFELRAKCRRLKMQHDIQLVIIDYLQLMSGASKSGGGNTNREQEISTISRGLKALAKELDIPVIALSQLSRAVETRSANDKRPQLSDLRESGAIEQDADIVTFIYRPEYYKITEDEQGNSTHEVAEVIIAKHRNGALQNIRLRFRSEFAKFMNWDDSDDDVFGTSVAFTNIPSAVQPIVPNTAAQPTTVPSRLNSSSTTPMPSIDDIPF